MPPSALADALGVSRAAVSVWEAGTQAVPKPRWPAIRAVLAAYVPSPTGPEVWFWPKVNKDGPIPAHMPHLGKCWVWTRFTTGGGYGGVRHDKIKEHAHRVSWTLEHGPIPDGLHVLHRCDNRPCVNPEHLFLGTQQDNFDDMVAKGRDGFRQRDNRRRGEANRSAKLTEADVIEMRRLYADTQVTQMELASRFQVSYALVNNIVNRKGWAHVP